MLEVTGGSMSTTFKSAGHDFPALYAVRHCNSHCRCYTRPSFSHACLGGLQLKLTCFCPSACPPACPPARPASPARPPRRLQASPLQKDNAAKMEALAAEGKAAHEPLRLTGVYATSGGTQRAVLIRKFFKLYWRNPNYSE